MYQNQCEVDGKCSDAAEIGLVVIITALFVRLVLIHNSMSQS